MIHTHQGYERYARERVREATAVYFEWFGAKRNTRLRPTTTVIGSGALLSFPRRDHSRHAQYKIKVGPSLTRAERWRARAEECRTLADCFTDPTCREQLR